MSTFFPITSASSGLITGGTTVSAQALDAYFYSFTQAQTDARTASSDPSTDAYYNAMISSLEELGWSVAQTKFVSQSISDRVHIPLVVCMLALLDAVNEGLGHLLQINQKHVESTANQLCKSLQNPPSHIIKQLDQWWDGATMTADARILNIGPLFDIFGVVHLIATHFALSLSVSSWRSFVSPSTNFSFSARPALMSLNWLVYRPQEAELKDRLQDELAENIQSTQLDLETSGAGL